MSVPVPDHDIGNRRVDKDAFPASVARGDAEPFAGEGDSGILKAAYKLVNVSAGFHQFVKPEPDVDPPPGPGEDGTDGTVGVGQTFGVHHVQSADPSGVSDLNEGDSAVSMAICRNSPFPLRCHPFRNTASSSSGRF